MNKFKKMISLLAAAAMLAVVPGANVMEVEAAPNTYYLKYDIEDQMWRMQINQWDEEYSGRELYYLNEGDEKVKDGDVVVVLNNEENLSGSTNIQINAHVSNLTINRANVVITIGGGIDECHVLGDSIAAINGDITNAYVYDNGTCTFNNNVTNLRLIGTAGYNTPRTTVTVGGTVAYASTANSGGILKEYYNFKAGTFHYDYASALLTDASNYSTSGSGPATGSSATTTTTTTTTQSNSSSSGEYDDVPKTGENNMVVWLFAAAAVCAAGSVALRKRENN